MAGKDFKMKEKLLLKKETLKAWAQLLRRENKIDNERYNRMIIAIDNLQRWPLWDYYSILAGAVIILHILKVDNHLLLWYH